MKPIKFDGYNVVYAENQTEYLPLPAYNDGRTCVSCWRLTIWERVRVFLFGKLWLAQLHFGGPLQPQRPSVSPLVEAKKDVI